MPSSTSPSQCLEKPVTKHYVEFLFAGIMFTDTSAQEIKSRSTKFQIPKTCFGYKFYDIEEVVSNGHKLKSGRLNETGVYYINARVLTLAQIRTLMPNSILQKNMENNGYKKVVKTRSGTYQPLEKGDQIVQ